MADTVDGWWPSEPQATPHIDDRVNTSAEAAYQDYLAGRLTRDEYTLVLNKNMERQKDWGSNR